MTKCKLCLETGKKLVESHIIPKSLYGTTLRDKSGPARVMSLAPEAHPKRSPKGEYDSSLLCDSCETSLSPFDDYAKSLLVDASPADKIAVNGKLIAFRYDGVDFEKLGKFFISLLWRMSATSRRMFAGLNLGPHEEAFRQATLQLDRHQLADFDIVISKFDRSDTGVLGPFKLRLEQVNGFRFSFAGYTFWAKVDQRPIPSMFDEIALSTGEPLHMLSAEFVDSPEFSAMLKIVKANTLK